MPDSDIIPYAPNSDDLNSALEYNLDGTSAGSFDPRDLPRASVPTGQETKWKITDIDGVEHEDEIRGVVIYHRSPRAYWSKSIEDGDYGPPDCSSEDGITGFGVRSEEESGDEPSEENCSSCPNNRWETSPKGKGKACRERSEILIMLSDSGTPLILSLPPTSIRYWYSYLRRLAANGQRYIDVETTFTLGPRSKGIGSIAIIKRFRELSLDEIEYLVSMQEEAIKALKGVNNVPVS